MAHGSAAPAAAAVSALDRVGGPTKFKAAAVASECASLRAASVRAAALRHAGEDAEDAHDPAQ
jgi:hypothetical protein